MSDGRPRDVGGRAVSRRGRSGRGSRASRRPAQETQTALELPNPGEIPSSVGSRRGERWSEKAAQSDGQVVHPALETTKTAPPALCSCRWQSKYRRPPTIARPASRGRPEPIRWIRRNRSNPLDLHAFQVRGAARPWPSQSPDRLLMQPRQVWLIRPSQGDSYYSLPRNEAESASSIDQKHRAPAVRMPPIGHLVLGAEIRIDHTAARCRVDEYIADLHQIALRLP